MSDGTIPPADEEAWERETAHWGRLRLIDPDTPGRVVGPADEVIGSRRRRDPAASRFHDAIATIFASGSHGGMEEAAETVRVIAAKARCMNLDQAQTVAMVEIIAEQAKLRQVKGS